MRADREANEQIRELLAGLDAAHAETVRPLLLSLQSMADGEAPAPSPELAALLKANGAPSTVTTARPRHRGLVFSLALIGALAAGTGTAAAVSPDFRLGAAHAIAGIIHAIPFGHPTDPNPLQSEPPTSTHKPASPGRGGGTTHPTPAPGDPTNSNGNGNGKSSSDHANPKSTNHPTPPTSPPGKGHGRAP
ncbi:MAG: hypothetical protein QOH69_802 [Actinomycetota bacterium]|jgi:hypothetical protein|nr:hypothetical protein [Actinomycetota bacterium]